MNISGIILASFLATISWWDTPEIRKCCSEADALYADEWIVLPSGDVKAKVTGGGPRNHTWAPIGREYIISKEKIVNVPGNPTGRPLIFISPTWHEQVFCFALGPMI